MDNHDYFFKIASSHDEFEQIHRLNYQTFSEEIPQHSPNAEQRLVDQFHSENTYIVCIKDLVVVGMIAIRANRPFSLDRKIGPVEQQLGFPINSPCEVRLLAVKKEFRNGRVFLGLVQFLIKYCLKKGYDIAVISGTVRQLKLYGQMGFKPFAHLTGTEDALYQPMYLTKTTFDESVAGRILPATIPFLPGPVQISENVRNALSQTPISHRSEEFLQKLTAAKKRLCQMVNSRYVQVFLGSGTLANDVVAAQLSKESGNGLILVNGEFGSRLTEQASRLGLSYVVVEKEWGQSFTKDEIVANLTSETTWIWAVHSETSSGMLNDVNMLKVVANGHSLKLCLDCISSIGAMEIDLEGVFLASGVSGKALRAFTGLSFVFHQHEVTPSTALPKYLDLGYYMQKDSIPFSQSSNLLEALLVALENINPETYRKIAERQQFLKEKLSQYQFTVISKDSSSPIILTIAIPYSLSSAAIGELVNYHGYQLHYESEYLKQRNWIQIACIDDYQVTDLEKMVNLLHRIVSYEQINSTKTFVQQ
jgi:aspartate aminotransferase-like enzyme